MARRLRFCDRALALLVAAGSLAPIAAPALAQSPQRPSTARRLVQLWDFEDPISRVEPVPSGWFRAQDAPPVRERPGYPGWNTPILFTGDAHSGRRALRLPTQGGNTSLTLAAGVIPAFPDGDYAVLARVRTVGLVHARARITLRFLSRDLLPIDGAESRTVPAISEGAWTTVETSITGRPDAAWLQLELELVQPATFDPPRSPIDLRDQDFRGEAQFDDVAIYQIPRVDLRTTAPASTIVYPDAPTLAAMVRDLTGEPLTLDLTVYDVDGRQIAAVNMPAPPSGRTTTWTPQLDRFGWYRAVLEVSGPSGPVGQQATDFIWCPAGTAPDAADRQSFGVIADDLGAPQLGALPDLLRRTQIGAATLPVWPISGPDESDKAAEASRRAAEALLNQGVDVTFMLSRVPESVSRAAKADTSDPVKLFTAEGDAWLPALSKTLANFGERVRRWQIGATADGEPVSPQDVIAVRERMQRIIPSPNIALAATLPRLAGVEASSPDAISVVWPVGVPTAAFPAAPAGEGPERTLVIETPPATVFGGNASAIELARRAVTGWAAGYRRLAIRSPWTWHPDRPGDLQPGVELAAWRNLSQRLSGARVVGAFPVVEGATALILSTPRGGMLVGWNESAPEGAAVIRGLLSESEVTATDAMGNPVQVRTSATEGHLVPLGEMPVFVDGVDLPLTRFRASMRLEPGFVPARAEKHTIELVVENPWPEGISGRIRLDDPPRWSIAPRVLGFNVGPGKTVRLPVEFAFTLGEEAGQRYVEAQVELYADRRYPLLRVPLPIEIGLPTVDLSVTYSYEPSPDGRTSDVVVTAVISNIADRPVTMEAFSLAPGYRVFDAPVSDLQPGSSATRRFRYENGAVELRGKTVRVGIKEQDGTGRLNKTLNIQ
jgi:hypothetical protein